MASAAPPPSAPPSAVICGEEVAAARFLDDDAPSKKRVPEEADVPVAQAEEPVLNAKDRRKLKRQKLQTDQEGVDAIFATL